MVQDFPLGTQRICLSGLSFGLLCWLSVSFGLFVLCWCLSLRSLVSSVFGFVVFCRLFVRLLVGCFVRLFFCGLSLVNHSACTAIMASVVSGAQRKEQARSAAALL